MFFLYIHVHYFSYLYVNCYSNKFNIFIADKKKKTIELGMVTESLILLLGARSKWILWVIGQPSLQSKFQTRLGLSQEEGREGMEKHYKMERLPMFMKSQK